MTIRKRLTLWYAALLTLIIVAFGAVTYGVMRLTMLNNIDSGLAETANLIIRNSRIVPEATFGTQTRINIDLASLDMLRAPSVYVQAWEMGEDGMVFKEASVTARPLGNTPLDSEALGTDKQVISNGEVGGVAMRVLTRPIIQSGSGRVVGNIQVAVQLSTVNQLSETLLVVMLIASGLAVVGAGLLSMWFSHRALKPIEDITDAASSIADTNDLNTRLDWRGPQDELGRLISVFNHMMGRIEHLFSVQQRFIADISHELRTPLTAIQGHFDLMKRYGADDMSIEAVESETSRMSRLVNDLLMLARADYGGMTIDLYPIDLDTVLMESFQQSQFLLKERDLTLNLEHVEPARIKGNSDRMKQVMYNLVSNAVKFTEDGGSISVGLQKVNGHAVLWVEDTGIGISEEDRKHVFDRFYQTESSRNSSYNSGFGLGLSITKWIVTAHEGSIAVRSQEGVGTVFTVTIPLYETVEQGGTDESTHSRPTRPQIPIIRRDRDKKHATREVQIVNKDTNGSKGESTSETRERSSDTQRGK